MHKIVWILVNFGWKYPDASESSYNDRSHSSLLANLVTWLTSRKVVVEIVEKKRFSMQDTARGTERDSWTDFDAVSQMVHNIVCLRIFDF